MQMCTLNRSAYEKKKKKHLYTHWFLVTNLRLRDLFTINKLNNTASATHLYVWLKHTHKTIFT